MHRSKKIVKRFNERAEAAKKDVPHLITIYLLFLGISREVKLLYLPLTREYRKFSGMTRDVIGFKMEK